MQKIDKTAARILSMSYKAWLDNDAVKHEDSYRYYYDDVVMNLYNCQSGVCAYTEMRICPPDLYKDENWENGRYKIANAAAYKRIDHLGELDHFDAKDKKEHYWNWGNLFMIEAKINGIKSDTETVPYLKPDLADYAPEKYFEYDEDTNRFIPHTDIDDPKITVEIQKMIDNVLCLNHGMIKNDRRDYINIIKEKKAKGEPFTIDRFFTSVRWTLG